MEADSDYDAVGALFVEVAVEEGSEIRNVRSEYSDSEHVNEHCAPAPAHAHVRAVPHVDVLPWLRDHDVISSSGDGGDLGRDEDRDTIKASVAAIVVALPVQA